MITPSQLLYMLDEDLYRFGNAASPKLNNVRPHDLVTYERNGIVMVRSTGDGISLITEARLNRETQARKGSYVWKLPANFPLPYGLILRADTTRLKSGQSPEHYLLCTDADLALTEYVGLLSKLALKLERMPRL